VQHPSGIGEPSRSRKSHSFMDIKGEVQHPFGIGKPPRSRNPHSFIDIKGLRSLVLLKKFFQFRDINGFSEVSVKTRFDCSLSILSLTKTGERNQKDIAC